MTHAMGAPHWMTSAAGRRALYFALLALVAATYLLLPYPPYQDLPAHAAMLAMRLRLPSSVFLQQYLQRGSCLGPYSTFLGLGHLLGPLLGAERALRIIGALANLALPAAVVLARRRILHDPWADAPFVALALSLGFLTAQGFSSFLLGLAAFVLAFAAWIDLLGQGGPRRGLVLAGLALASALTHGFAFVLLLSSVAISALAAGGWRSSARGRVLLGAAALAPGLLFLTAVYLRDRGLYPPDVNDTLVEMRGVAGKAQAMFLPTVFSRLGLDAAACAVLYGLLGRAAVRALRGRDAGARDAVARQRAVIMKTAIVLLVLAVAAPARLGFFGSLDVRLATAALLLATLGAAPATARAPSSGGRLDAILTGAPAPLATVMVLLLGITASLFQREARAVDTLLDRVPTGARLLYLPVDPFSRYWAASPFFHMEKRALFHRDLLVSNVWLHPGTALRATPAGLPLLTTTPVDTGDGQIPWSRYDVRPWDYVLTRTSEATAPPPVPPSLELVGAADRMRLYRNRAR
jgi:hypothetical protein